MNDKELFLIIKNTLVFYANQGTYFSFLCENPSINDDNHGTKARATLKIVEEYIKEHFS